MDKIITYISTPIYLGKNILINGKIKEIITIAISKENEKDNLNPLLKIALDLFLFLTSDSLVNKNIDNAKGRTDKTFEIGPATLYFATFSNVDKTPKTKESIQFKKTIER